MTAQEIYAYINDNFSIIKSETENNYEVFNEENFADAATNNIVENAIAFDDANGTGYYDQIDKDLCKKVAARYFREI